jgi:S1-C subfamily serine protease
MAKYYRLPLTEGALVIQIEPSSPAYNAGIRKGDIIKQVDGNKITEPSEISIHIRKKQVGDEIIMTINRNGKLIQIPLELEENNIIYRR